MVFNCKFEENGVCEKQILQKFDIDKIMDVMISYSNIPNKVNSKSTDKLPFWEKENYRENWQETFYDNNLFPLITKKLLILNGFHII